SRSDYLGHKSRGLALQSKNVRADLLKRPQRHGFIEIPGETDLVANRCPGVGRVRQNLAADEGFNAAGFLERDGLSVAQFAIRFVFDHAALATYRLRK